MFGLNAHHCTHSPTLEGWWWCLFCRCETYRTYYKCPALCTSPEQSRGQIKTEIESCSWIMILVQMPIIAKELKNNDVRDERQIIHSSYPHFYLFQFLWYQSEPNIKLKSKNPTNSHCYETLRWWMDKHVCQTLCRMSQVWNTNVISISNKVGPSKQQSDSHS